MGYRPDEVMFGFGETDYGVHVALVVQRRPRGRAVSVIEIDNIDLDCELCLQNGFLSVGPNVWTLIEDITQQQAAGFLTRLGLVQGARREDIARALNIAEGRAPAGLGFSRVQWATMVVTSVAIASWVTV